MFFFAFIAPSPAPAADSGEGRFIVRDVDFIGVKNINKKSLSASLVVTPPPAWKFWKAHPVANRQEVSADVLRIRQHYRNQGYYQTKVDYEIICPETCRDNSLAEGHSNGSDDRAPASREEKLCSCEVKFSVSEGSPVRIRAISLECREEIPTVSKCRIRSELPFQTGDIFKTLDYENAKLIIRQLLGNKGYPFAEIKGDALVDLATHSADITFTVMPGELYYFGKINISGHEDYVAPTVIERSLAFQPGQQYEAGALDQSRRNLFDLRIFQTAVIERGSPDKAAHTVPVNIRVKPRKQHNVKFGIGYGTEDGLRLRGEWGYRNLTGHADRLTLSAKRSDLQETIQGEYFYPYFLSARNNLITNAGYEREEAEYYTLRKMFTDASLHHNIGANWTAVPGYDLTINRTDDIDVAATDGDYEIEENYRISAMRLDLERNTVDNELNPSKGTVFRIGMEKASGYLGSEIDYTRPRIETRMYIPLPWQMLLAGRLRMSAIEAAEDTDEIPIFKQLFLGGSKTVRGYGYQQMGVIDSNDRPIAAGGLSSLNANVELRYPIYKKFSGVAFVDMGVLDEEPFRYNLKRMRYSCGLGLRYNTVIGPIQVDVGYKLNPPGDTQSSDPEIQDLANPDLWRLHVNIGQAF